ncbi:MAG TPA: RHS repeat-associated core domain-containing protein, partial [Rhodothermales bacterium]|nr:RHS repeat-associated core domain-containing protein [Rhodothermales bacterium]
KRSNLYYVTQWDVESRKVTRYVFKLSVQGSVWPLVSIEDVTGRGLDLLYDASGQLTGIRQRLEQRTLQLEYTGANRIASVSLAVPGYPRHRLMQYEYNQQGQLAAAYDALGFADRYTYDEAGRIKRETVKDGGVFSFQYDDTGRCVRRAGSDNYDARSLRFLDTAGLTEVTDSHGHITRFERLPSGQVITEINPLGGITKTEYDEHGRIVAKTDPLDNVTHYEYDDQGNRSKSINALGFADEWTFNQAHQPLTFTNPAGYTWQWRYDQYQRLVVSEDPEGNKYTLSYDGQGNLVRVMDPRGYTLQQYFTSNGVLRASTDWGGHTSKVEIDEFGRLGAEVDPFDHRTEYQYDEKSQLLRVDYPDGTYRAYNYDAAGNPIRVTNQNEHTTQYRYGPCKRLLQRIDALGNTLMLEWGSELAQLKSVTNAKGAVYRFYYNPLGTVQKEIGFEGSTLEYEFNAAGQRTASINGLGERNEFQRDALGRLVGHELADGSQASFSYDAAGSLEAATNQDSELRFVRDSLGRVIQEEQNGVTLERRYDGIDRVRHLQSSLGFQVDYTVDGNGDLTQVTINGEAQDATTMERNARGSVVRRTLAGQQVLEQEYDPLQRLVNQTLVQSSSAFAPGLETAATLVNRSYLYEQDQVAAIRDAHWGSTAYVIDPLDRVTQTLKEKGVSEWFQYDGDDNLTRVATETQTTTLTYSDGNRLLQKEETVYEYDAQGRLVQKTEPGAEGQEQIWRYDWDPQDQLRAFTNPDGETWHYTYDPFGRRIAKQAPEGSTTRFVWDRDVVLQEVQGEAVAASWVFDGFVPLCKLEGGHLYSVVTDHLGTPREMISQAGEVVWRATYSTWGVAEVVQAGEVDCPVRFQGQWYDAESGLYYNRYRYYDPSAARYISLDPIRLAGGSNIYSYVFNPTMWIDPLGLGISNVNTSSNTTHITYVGTKGGEPYVGYASRPGNHTGESVLSYRYSSNYAAEGLDGPPTVVFVEHGQTKLQSQYAKARARGLEQRYFEQHGGLDGTANRQNPVGEGNANRDVYLEEADKVLAAQQSCSD